MNLYSYVVNPFTEEAIFDYDLFKKDVFIAQKLMDDLIDIEEEKINIIINKISKDPEPFDIKYREMSLWVKIKSKLLKGRRTGLGVTALADMIAALGLTYGSKAATDVSEDIIKTMAKESYKSSIVMARERGAFEDWKFKTEKNNNFILRITNELVKDLGEGFYISYAKYGRRNIANLTCAPSGSISILTQTSSGLEPVYSLTYTRRRKTEDGWEEYTMIHPQYSKSLKISNKNSSPYDKSTANEINPISKIEMQGKLQKWIDHSISITNNLPENTKEEKISEIYFKAWELGCKGCTVYRDNSRAGILTTKRNPEFKTISAIKRPKILDGELFTAQSQGLKYNVIVGLIKNKPYEIFATTHLLTSKQKIDIQIEKQARSIYNVIGEVERQSIMIDMPEENQVITRLASGMLRHGANVKYVADQLLKVPGELSSFSKLIARTLKRYIIDNEKATGHSCPECGADPLIYQEGCVKCKVCGFSKC